MQICGVVTSKMCKEKSLPQRGEVFWCACILNVKKNSCDKQQGDSHHKHSNEGNNGGNNRNNRGIGKAGTSRTTNIEYRPLPVINALSQCRTVAGPRVGCALRCSVWLLLLCWLRALGVRIKVTSLTIRNDQQRQQCKFVEWLLPRCVKKKTSATKWRGLLVCLYP